MRDNGRVAGVGFVNALLGVAAVYWMVYLALNVCRAGITGDEMLDVWVSAHRFPSIIMLKAAKSVIAAPPGDFLFLALFERLFHGLANAVGMMGELFFRLPYMGAVVGGAFLLLNAFLKAGVRPWVALWGVLFTYTLTQGLNGHALESRFYAWLIFFTCLTHLTYVGWLTAYEKGEDRLKRRAFWIWIGSVFVGVFFHAFVFISGLGQAAAIFMRGDRRDKKWVAGGIVAVGVLFKIWSKIGMNMGGAIDPKAFFMKGPYLQAMTAFGDWFPPLSLDWRKVFICSLVSFVLMGLVGRRRQLWGAVWLPLLGAFFIPTVSVGGGHFFAARHLVFIVPLFSLVVTYGVNNFVEFIVHLWNRRFWAFPKGIAFVFSVLLMAGTIVCWGKTYFKFIKFPGVGGDMWPRVNALLNRKTPEIVYGLVVSEDVSQSDVERGGRGRSPVGYLGFVWQYYLLGYDHMTLMPYSEAKKYSILKEARACGDVRPGDEKKTRVSFCDADIKVNGISALQ